MGFLYSLICGDGDFVCWYAVALMEVSETAAEIIDAF